MRREYVTPERLLEVLNEKLHEDEECQDCEFRRPPHGPKDPDEDGCNWSSSPDLLGRCSGCGPNLTYVIQWTRERYNLLPRA